MSNATHLLTKPHSMLDEDGHRRRMPAGTPCSPTERQVKNMPDVFAPIDGSAPRIEQTAHRLKEFSVGGIKELVENVEDIELLDEYAAEEESGRNRKGAMAAIVSRMAYLTSRDEE